MILKKCFKCSNVWMSSNEDSSVCPNCHKFDNQILNIDREVRKADREKIKKASIFS